ncbi:MAG: hypothetical protein HYX34_14675 [Actinobacteria bacterium]|nr:hypothetical protein [Actinomycetota bacterium]
MTAEAPAPAAAHGQPAPDPDEPGWITVGFALAGGPALWTVHLVASAALVPLSCARDLSWTINAATIGTALGTLWSMWVAWGLVRRRLGSTLARPHQSSAVRFLGLLGLLWGTVSLALIVLEGIPNLALSPCLR